MRNMLPAWAMPVCVLAAALLIAGFVWAGMNRLTPNPGPDKEVRPGMYNLREAMNQPPRSASTP